MKVKFEDWDTYYPQWDPGVGSLGHATAIYGPIDNPPKKHFNIGFHVASPGPSHDEQKKVIQNA